MRVFVAGAGGVIGRQLVPLLQSQGHAVVGLVRRPKSRQPVLDAGADEVVVADALDRDSVVRAVTSAEPEAVINQLTALPRRLTRVGKDMRATDELRVLGNANLLLAAQAAGADRFVAQSQAFPLRPHHELVVDDDHPFAADARGPGRRMVKSLDALEVAALAEGGVVLRYGSLYGPGTWFAPDGYFVERIRQRRLPIIGSGRGVTGFVHVWDAAAAAAAALAWPSGRYHVVDEEPASTEEWATAIAEAIGAPRPFRVPEWLARRALGWYTTHLATRQPATSADRIRRLGLGLRFPSWRAGLLPLA